MMNKEQLIDAIREIQDQSILDDLSRLIEIKNDEAVFITSDHQKVALDKAREDVRVGRVLDSKKADKEINEWLDK